MLVRGTKGSSNMLLNKREVVIMDVIVNIRKTLLKQVFIFNEAFTVMRIPVS